jgi:large subunit ribosomal protein L10e
MAKLRKWCAYKKVERPYTRWSKVRKKAFVKSRPGKKVIKYNMGDIILGDEQFPIHLTLVSKDLAQIRTNAIEASRITGLKRLETKLGRKGFYFRIRAVPHQMVRENPLAAGAGADRLSTGMKHSFGKIIGTSCQVKEGKIIYDIFLPKGQEEFGRSVLKLMSKKLPIRTRIEVDYRKVVALTEEEIAHREMKDKARTQGAKIEADAEAAAEAAISSEDGAEAAPAPATEEEKKE